jgi:hypothetical protein
MPKQNEHLHAEDLNPLSNLGGYVDKVLGGKRISLHTELQIQANLRALGLGREQSSDISQQTEDETSSSEFSASEAEIEKARIKQQRKQELELLKQEKLQALQEQEQALWNELNSFAESIEVTDFQTNAKSEVSKSGLRIRQVFSHEGEITVLAKTLTGEYKLLSDSQNISLIKAYPFLKDVQTEMKPDGTSALMLTIEYAVTVGGQSRNNISNNSLQKKLKELSQLLSENEVSLIKAISIQDIVDKEPEPAPVEEEVEFAQVPLPIIKPKTHLSPVRTLDEYALHLDVLEASNQNPPFALKAFLTKVNELPSDGIFHVAGEASERFLETVAVALSSEKHLERCLEAQLRIVKSFSGAHGEPSVASWIPVIEVIAVLKALQHMLIEEDEKQRVASKVEKANKDLRYNLSKLQKNLWFSEPNKGAEAYYKALTILFEQRWSHL